MISSNETGRTKEMRPKLNASSETTISAIFERQAREAPDQVALVFNEFAITYQQLNEQANCMARYLRQAGVKKETLVAICLDQSVEKVISMLAVLKAGGAYIPLDPHYPASRINFILEDTNAPFLLTQTSLAAKLTEFKGQTIYLDTATVQEQIAAFAPGNLTAVNTGADLMYIIYTSGSTGTPKGVMIEHRSVAAFTAHHSKVLGIQPMHKALQFSSTSFDAAVIDLWIPLLQGATLYLYPNNKFIGAHLLDFIRQHQIDIVPLISPTVLSSLPVNEPIGNLTVIGIGGEVCPPYTMQYWSEQVKLFNSYGPTEATVAVTSILCGEHLTPKTIGKAAPDIDLYILDEQLNEVAYGMPGELLVGGIQIARGYLNRPEITAEKFIKNPFAPTNPDSPRLYRTGDLVRQLPDGNIEFAGRMDDQVKIRGYRIELGEIESALSALKNVRQAVVLPRDGQHGHVLLVAFIVPDDALPVDTATIVQQWRQTLLQVLPTYMVPDRFELLEKMPVNVHGKIDKEQLHLSVTNDADDPLPANNLAPEDYAAAISRVWAKYLPTGQINNGDDFFQLGGHSLLLMQVYSSLPVQISKHIQIPDLYAYPTIDSLVTEVRKREMAKALTTQEKEQAIIRELLQDAQLRVDFNVTTTPAPAVLAAPAHLFLTGATGFVGAHLLAELLAGTQATIHCLIRADDDARAMDRLRHTFKKFNQPWNPELEDRIIPVTGDLSLPMFGLDAKRYEKVTTDIDVIYHSGSSVSYLQPYPVIKGPNIDGLQEIIRLATTGKMKYLALLSSMGVFSWGRPFTRKTWMNEEDSIEQNLPAVSRDLGYIKSKWVMEKMIQEAITKGLQVINFRLGFAVCHSQTGATVKSQWWGSLVRSCVAVGAFPLVMGLKDELTTVDYMVKAIVHIAKNKDSVGKNFHLSPNPENDVSLTDFFAKMNEYYGLQLKGLPYHEWLALWKEDKDNPLYPLLSLFTDDVHEGKSLVEAYENTYYYDRSNTRHFLKNAALTPPVFDKNLMTPYLTYMGLLPERA
jgi:amino acid adenylation domain-containing protein/thioester reductase-like protein